MNGEINLGRGAYSAAYEVTCSPVFVHFATKYTEYTEYTSVISYLSAALFAPSAAFPRGELNP